MNCLKKKDSVYWEKSQFCRDLRCFQNCCYAKDNVLFNMVTFVWGKPFSLIRAFRLLVVQCFYFCFCLVTCITNLNYVLTSGNLLLYVVTMWVGWFGEMVKELQIPQSLFWWSVLISLRTCVAWDKHREFEKKIFH